MELQIDENRESRVLRLVDIHKNYLIIITEQITFDLQDLTTK